MTPSYQENLEQLEAKGEEVRQLQDALLIAEGHLRQMTLRSAKAISLREEMDALRAERDALRTEVQRLRALVERAFQEGQDGRILDGHEQFIYDVAWEHSDAFKALAVQP